MLVAPPADIQYSAACIAQMSERHSEQRPEMTWLEMDILDLKFGEEFDIVVDKGECQLPGT